MEPAAWTALASIVIAIVSAVSTNQALKYKASAANVESIEKTLGDRLVKCEQREKECLEENAAVKKENVTIRKENAALEVRITTLEAQANAGKP